MNKLFLLLGVLLVACAQPSIASDAGPPTTTVDVYAAPSIVPSIDRPVTPEPPYIAPPPDPRTPTQIAQAACMGPGGAWLCKSPKPRVFATTVGSPIIPPSWTVSAWFIDASNTTTCAADTNNCTSSTCGATGSGVGPCLTWHEVNDHRWGCFGQYDCPRLAQNTTITFLSSQSGASDPVYYRPAVENGALIILQGNPTAVTTISASGVVAKNRTTPQLLNVTLGASGALGQLLVNTTHASHAFTYKLVSGTTFSITQPLVSGALPHNAAQAEVDTWANGDSITLETVPAVDLVEFLPTIVDGATGSQNNGKGYINQITGLAPSAAGDTMWINTQVRAFDSTFQRRVQIQDVGNDWQFTPGAGNNIFQNGLNRNGVSSQYFLVTGGAIANTAGGDVPQGYLSLDADIILNTTVLVQGVAEMLVGLVSYDTSGLLGCGGGSELTFGNFNGYGGGSPILWGTGSALGILASHNCRVAYPAGAGGAAATFKNTGATGFTLDGQSLTCLGKPGAASSYATCNITATPANLDTNLGAASGCLGVPNGASLCNFGQ